MTRAVLGAGGDGGLRAGPARGPRCALRTRVLAHAGRRHGIQGAAFIRQSGVGSRSGWYALDDEIPTRSTALRAQHQICTWRGRSVVGLIRLGELTSAPRNPHSFRSARTTNCIPLPALVPLLACPVPCARSARCRRPSAGLSAGPSGGILAANKVALYPPRQDVRLASADGGARAYLATARDDGCPSAPLFASPLLHLWPLARGARCLQRPSSARRMHVASVSSRATHRSLAFPRWSAPPNAASDRETARPRSVPIRAPSMRHGAARPAGDDNTDAAAAPLLIA